MLSPEARSGLFRLDSTPFHRAKNALYQMRSPNGSLIDHIDYLITGKTMTAAVDRVVANLNEITPSADSNIRELAIKLAFYRFYPVATGAEAEQQVHRRIDEHLPDIASDWAQYAGIVYTHEGDLDNAKKMFRLSVTQYSDYRLKSYDEEPEHITQFHQTQVEAYRAKVGVWCEQLPAALELRESILVGLTEDQLQALPAVFKWQKYQRITSFGLTNNFGFEI